MGWIWDFGPQGFSISLALNKVVLLKVEMVHNFRVLLDLQLLLNEHGSSVSKERAFAQIYLVH